MSIDIFFPASYNFISNGKTAGTAVKGRCTRRDEGGILLMKQMPRNTRVVITLVFLIVFTGCALAEKVTVIEDPKPNMVEKSYHKLVRVKKLDLEFDDDNMIYNVCSVAVDRERNLFIYDRIQTKIFVLDKEFRYVRSFGRQGRGPGEFYGNRFGVHLNIGNDGNLYANDHIGRHVSVFSKNGQFLKRYATNWTKLTRYVADKNGNCYGLQFDEKKIIIHNLDGKKLFSIPYKKEDRAFLFLDPSDRLESCGWQRMVLTKEGKFILFITQSGTLFTVENGKLINKARIWPRDLLKEYEKQYALVRSRSEGDSVVWLHPFFYIAPDYDNEDQVYLVRIDHKTLKTRSVMIYRVGLDGSLKKVLFIDAPIGVTIPEFHAKTGGYFYCTDDENIYLYEEDSI